MQNECKKCPKNATKLPHYVAGDFMLKETKYIDTDTGEIYASKQQYVGMQFDEEKGYLFWNRKSHNKLFHDVDFPEVLNITDIGRLTLLSKHIWRDSNLLAWRGNGGIKAHNIKTISKIVQLKERQTRTFIKRLIVLQILARVEIEVGNKKTNHYYINPIYYCSSKRISLNLYLIFKDSLDKIIPDWVKGKFIELDKNKNSK